MKRLFHSVSVVLGLSAVSVGLSGCIVAAIPLVMAAGAAGVAATGFVVYKSVQTTSGGTVQIAFGSSDPKHPVPPQPLTVMGATTVVPGGGREKRFGEVLKSSAKFSLVQADPRALQTAAEGKLAGYESLCSHQRINLVMAAIDEGQVVKSNMMSFKRGALTDTFTLEGYACAAHKVVWGDKMAIIIESGRAPTPQAEIDSIAGQAWAERVLLASKTG